MSKPLVSDELWTIVQPLLPPEPPKPKGGRPRVPDRAALTGILFVLKAGLPWEWLPRELGCGSGMTCWRRLRDWNKADIWHRLHTLLLDRLGAASWTGSLARASSRASDSDDSGGWRSERSLGSSSSAAWPSATSGATTSTRRSWISGARSSASECSHDRFC